MTEVSRTATVKVVGVSFTPSYPHNLHHLAERAATEHLGDEGLSAVLVRNPANPYDSNAVEVHIPALGDDGMIGHIDRASAARLAPRLDDGERFQCWVAGVRIMPGHEDRPGIDVAVRRVLPDE